MVVGLGSDLIDIRRIERVLERYGETFLARIFTAAERARSERCADRAASYARRYAAKEACSKALGTGFLRGVFWRDMGVINLATGMPALRLTGGALARLGELVPAGMEPRIDVTLTDEPPMAHAMVLITCVPKAGD